MSGKVSGAKSFFERDAVKEVLVWIFQIAVVLACAVVAAIFFFQTVTMQEGSMEPTLASGDRFFINRMAYKLGTPERGDLIVFKTSPKEDASLHIKRVIGLPGEKVEFRENEIYINGNRLEEKYQSTAVDRTGIVTEKMELGSDEYFVLGDDRENSEDSRDADVGNVKREHIFGKAWFVISPRDSFGFIKE